MICLFPERKTGSVAIFVNSLHVPKSIFVSVATDEQLYNHLQLCAIDSYNFAEYSGTTTRSAKSIIVSVGM